MFTTRYSSIFLVNDDVLIDHLLSGRTFNIKGDVPPFISFILSKILIFLYSIVGINISLWGIFLFIINLFIALIILNIVINSKFKYQAVLGVFIICVLFPTLFYSPTFTITAFLAIGIGYIGLFYYLLNSGHNYVTIFLLILLIILGILIRPQAFFGFLVFFGLMIIYIVFKSDRFVKIVFSISFLLVSFVYLIDKFLKIFFLKNSVSHLNYFNFIELRAELSFTNAIFKAQQLLIENAIPNSPFANTDFLMLLNWFNLDKSKFNFVNLNYIISFVNDYRGINALFNTNFSDNIERLITETSSLNKFWMIYIFILLTVIGNNFSKSNLYLIGILFLSYLFGFYFLAAAGRLPYRTIFPIAILLLISLFLIQNLNYRRPKNYISFFICSVLILFAIDFHSNNYFGFKQMYKSNNESLNFYKKRDKEISIFLKEENVIIGPLDSLPMSIQGTTNKNILWESSSNLLSIDWTVGSPSWDIKARSLNIYQGNIFKSLTNNKSFYYAGTSDSAHIMEDYMIQNNIDSGELCSVKILYGLNVFTYQAKENEC